MNEPLIDIDLLLAQSGWLKRLARQLVADPGLADDAVQDTLVAAIDAPPQGAASRPVLRAWLRQVLHGRVHGNWRSGQRRRDRERVAARPESLEDTAADAIVGRAESSQLLVEEVHGLPEPHRSMLLLSYFEGLSAAEIALQLGSQQGAVRTRLSRARKALRERLDRRHGGDRGAWMRALAPLVGLPGTASIPAVAVPAAALLALSMMAKIAIAACLLLAGIYFLILPATSGGSAGTTETGRTIPAAAQEIPSTDTAAPARGSGRVAVSEPPPAPNPHATHEALGRDGLFRPLMRGRVTDGGGQPVAGALVSGTWGPHGVDGGPQTEALSDVDGWYSLVMPARAPLSPHSYLDDEEPSALATIKLLAACTAEGYKATGAFVVYPPDEPGELEQSFLLDSIAGHRGVRLRVLDPEGSPVAGAGVALFDPATGRVHEDEEGRMVWLITGTDGWAQSPWRPAIATIPFAMTIGGLHGRGELLAAGAGTGEEVVIGTTANVGLSGLLLDASSRPVPGERVTLVRADARPEEEEWSKVRLSHSLFYTERPWAGFSESRCHVKTGLDGRFRVGHLAAGTYWARLEDDSVHGPFALGSDVVLRLEGTYSVMVRAVDHEGRALRGAALVASNPSSSRSGGYPDRLQYVRIRLAEGRWRLTAHHGDAESTWRDVDVPREVNDPISLVLNFAVEPVPVTLRVVDPDGKAHGARLHTERILAAGASPSMMWRDREQDHSADEGICHTSLRPGRYLVRVDPLGQEVLPTRSEITVDDHGESVHSIEVKPGGRVLLRWSSPLRSDTTARPRLFVRPAGSEGSWASTDRSGGAYLDDLSPTIVQTAAPFDPSGESVQPGPLLSPGTWDLRVEGEGVVPLKHTIVVQAGVAAEVDVTFD